MSDNSQIINYFTRDLIDLKFDKKLNFKFVIIQHQESLNLIYGPLESFPYHANLVNKFCQESDIPSAWSHKPDFVEIFDPESQIRGGGWVELNNLDKLLTFYSYSTAYGKYKLSDLESIIEGTKNFIGFKILFN